MTRSPDPEPSGPAPQEPFAARLRAKYGEGVDPEVSLGGEPTGPGEAEAQSGSATDELLRRLSEHGLKSPRYKLEGEVARGGMGAILRVWDEDLRRYLAMKVVLGKGDAPGSARTPQVDTRALARFLEEAQVTGQLDHPGIVPVHELGLDADGRVYFTMKLVKGRDLKAIFDLVFEEKEGWNETRALSVILRACEAVAYAHRKGVIHRDLKPANIMVGNFGEVFVMDWGLARVLGRKDSHDIRIAPEFASALSSVKTERREELSDSPIVTLDGDVMGTPSYMAPEQARGEIEKLGPRSDVYSMGALLYHLLARRAPYVPAGARVSNRMVLQWVLEGAPKPLHEVRPDVPAELAAIVEKAMAREAERRYADTLALAEDLRAYTEHRVVSAYETGAVAEFRKWVQRNKPLAASIAAALVLAIGGLAWVSIVQSQAREAMTKKNTELAGATKAAQEKEKVATQKTNDVLSLSAIQDLKELENRADALWPADPELLPEYEAWLADARALIEGQPADEAKGLKARPSLAQHEAKLAEIRLRAKPLTPEQAAADHESSPSFAEWEKARSEHQWKRRMLGEEPWPSEAEVEAELSMETLPSDAKSLNHIAWMLVDVDPAKVAYGGEVRGLVLARRAVAASSDEERAGIRDTLGLALYRCGRLDEALSEEQRAVDEAQGQQKQELTTSLKELRELVASWKRASPGSGEEGPREKRVAEVSSLGARVAVLEREVGPRRTYEFEDGEDRWWHAQLSKLVADLKAFTDAKTGGLFSTGTSEKHGWGIARRAEFARTIQERSVDGPEARMRWEEAIAAIAASPKYGGLKFEPQLGLLPIGADRESGLWEFAYLATGEPPERGSDGKLIVNETMGLVLVLIPGGTFRMGAQSTDPAEPNYDPQAGSNESPVHEVTLSPYFLSKYEMTQGQWERFTGRNPSSYGPGNYSTDWNRAGEAWSALHPVEQVSWTQCTEVMSRIGLSLPSEAQWENGARGGTHTPYWTGSDLESLKDAANLSDAYGKSHGDEATTIWESDFDDGNSVHAEVGAYRANPFGLHEVLGNVWEWCTDGYDSYRNGAQVDPVAPSTGAPNRVIRGGGYTDAASLARSAERDGNTPEIQRNIVGLRPARAARLSASRLHSGGR